MMRNGWNVDVDYSNGEDKNKANEMNCIGIAHVQLGTGTFYGYKEGDRVGSVGAIFQGEGKCILRYGNCYSNTVGYVSVYLNGVEIAKTHENDWAHFQYRKGDFLEIKEHKTAIIKLVSLDVKDGGKYSIEFSKNILLCIN